MYKKKLNFLFIMLFALCGQTAYCAPIEDENYLTIKPFFITPGATVKVALEIENNLAAYGYQTEILLPEGITVPNVKVGSMVLYNKGIVPVAGRMYGDTGLFNLTAQGKKDGSIILLAYSDYYLPFEGNSGAVAEITLVADEGILPGVYSLQLRNSEVTVLLDDEEVGAIKPLTDIAAVCGTLSDEGTTLAVAGKFGADALVALNTELALHDDVTAVDMSNVSECGGEVVTSNPNALIYTNGTLNLKNSANVVANGVCNNLTITDGYAFSAKGEFEILAGHYERSLAAGKFGTVVLPFTPDDATKSAYNFYTFASKVDNFLVFEEVNAPEAGTPYIYENVSGKSGSGFSAAACKVSDVISEDNAGEWKMRGTYKRLVLTDAETLEHTYYVSNNMIMCATEELSIKPFRAYMNGPLYSDAFGTGAQQAIGIRLDGATAVDVITGDDEERKIVYDLMGRKCDSKQSGVIIIDGKKYYKKN